MAEPDETLANEAIAGWNKGQATCRARQRHDWRPFNVRSHRTFYDVVEQCAQCKSRRHRPLSQAGYWQDKWKFERYSPGYLMPKGSGGLDEDNRATLRLMDVLGRKMTEVPDDGD